MIGTRIHKIRKTELLDVAETLQGRGIEQGKRKLLHFNIAMDRIFDNFHRFTKESSYTSHKSIE